MSRDKPFICKGTLPKSLDNDSVREDGTGIRESEIMYYHIYKWRKIFQGLNSWDYKVVAVKWYRVIKASTSKRCRGCIDSRS